MIEGDVGIYAGATILSRVTIGQGVVIRGNGWLTGSMSTGNLIHEASAECAQTAGSLLPTGQLLGATWP